MLQAVCAKRRPPFFVPQILSDTRSPASLLPESAVFCPPPREYRLLPFSRNCRATERNFDRCAVIFDVLLFHSQK